LPQCEEALRFKLDRTRGLFAVSGERWIPCSVAWLPPRVRSVVFELAKAHALVRREAPLLQPSVALRRIGRALSAVKSVRSFNDAALSRRRSGLTQPWRECPVAMESSANGSRGQR
jgi:hypothetical protein